MEPQPGYGGHVMGLCRVTLLGLRCILLHNKGLMCLGRAGIRYARLILFLRLVPEQNCSQCSWPFPSAAGMPSSTFAFKTSLGGTWLAQWLSL